MASLHIEWKHLDKDGKTCDRCSNTGDALREAIRKLEAEGISVTLTETLLTADEIPDSNEIRFNGIPLESLVDDAAVGENECDCCSDLVGEKTLCRTLEVKGEVFEAIEVGVIRDAALRAAERCSS